MNELQTSSLEEKIEIKNSELSNGEEIEIAWQKYKVQLADQSFKFITENILVASTLVATLLTIIQFCFPEHYIHAVSIVTAWLAVKKGH